MPDLTESGERIPQIRTDHRVIGRWLLRRSKHDPHHGHGQDFVTAATARHRHCWTATAHNELSRLRASKGFIRTTELRRIRSNSTLSGESSPRVAEQSTTNDPASQALTLPRADLLRAQAFQNAVCNWRCWYCYVPFGLLSANLEHSAWLSAEDSSYHHFARPILL